MRKNFNERIYEALIYNGIEPDQAYNLVIYYTKQALQLLNKIKNEIHH